MAAWVQIPHPAPIPRVITNLKRQKLHPTPKEIQEYAELRERDYGVVTYSKSKGGDYYFLKFHDTWKQKIGGRIHIDVGYVNEKYVDDWEITDTTHLMPDKHYAPDFVQFIKQRREMS